MQMNMDVSQQQKISQKMILSSQILQFTVRELHQYLEELSLENPMMEFVPPVEHWDSFGDRRSPERTKEQSPEEERFSDYWNTAACSGQDLTTHLIRQMQILPMEDLHRRILSYMIHNLETSGYLSIPLVEIQNTFGCQESQAAQALELLQGMDPCGVGARDLGECLCIQLRQQHPQAALALRIVEEALDLLGKNQLRLLSKKLHRSIPEIQQAVALIQSLNPKPGASFSDSAFMQYIQPELLIRQEADRFYPVLRESAASPVRLDGYYLSLLDHAADPETSLYLQQKKEQVDWVNQCIRQRNQTLLALGELICQTQAAFFRHGPESLQAFTQSQAAQLLQVHESTISRAVREKHLECAWGVFPLKTFFTQGHEQKQAILARIAHLIEREDKRRPLSDQVLSDILKKEGLAVSKRLVCKYRNELDIPDSSLRKKF